MCTCRSRGIAKTGINPLTFGIVSKGSAQKISTFPRIARLVITSTSWYTCPLGKKAHVKGYVIVDSFGASSLVNVRLDPPGGARVSADIIVTDEKTDAEFDMIAGEVLGYSQNVGSNATIDGVWTIQETLA